MENLAARDLEAVLAFVDEVHSIPDLDSFRAGILPSLETLVPCDLSGYNEVDTEGDGTVVITHPEPHEDTAEPLARLAHEHPLISRQEMGDRSARTISEFLTVREFHDLGLYAEVYRPIGAEDQIAFGLPGDRVIGIAMNRGKRSFGDRDRMVLDLLRTHLTHVYRNLGERDRERQLIGMIERGLADGDVAVIAPEPDGRIAEASADAAEILDAFFPEVPEGMVPPPIADWLGRAPSDRRGGLSFEGGPGLLAVALVEGDSPAQPVLKLEVDRVASLEELRDLGLTPRQAEVLRLIALGRGTAEVASELFLSPATVRKHLENIYVRLGVNSRKAAVAMANATAGKPG